MRSAVEVSHRLPPQTIVLCLSSVSRTPVLSVPKVWITVAIVLSKCASLCSVRGVRARWITGSTIPALLKSSESYRFVRWFDRM
jgi:hypothetical protein